MAFYTETDRNGFMISHYPKQGDIHMSEELKYALIVIAALESVHIKFLQFLEKYAIIDI